MKFYSEFILSDSIDISREKLKEKILLNHVFFHTYVITLPLYLTDNQLEIFHIEITKQPLFNPDKYIIIGVAKGYQDAIELVEKITNMIYKETDSADIKKYYMSKINI